MTETGDSPDQTDAPGPDLDALAEAYNRGLAAEHAGDIAAAVLAYREVLAIDPDDRGGVSVRLAALGEGEIPEAAPPAYVATLFDQTAERFDEILVEQLGYSVPMMLRELLDQRGVRPAARLLDLGCGTGLAGVSLADRARHLTGCDLSAEMVSIAYDREVYTDLYIAEAVMLLESWDEDPFDLIVATDVLPYLGAVDPLFAGVAAHLLPGGHFAFSTETLPGDAFDARGYAVGPRQRFAHAPDHLRARLKAHGLTVTALAEITVRWEDGAPVHGHLFLARRDG